MPWRRASALGLAAVLAVVALMAVTACSALLGNGGDPAASASRETSPATVSAARAAFEGGDLPAAIRGLQDIVRKDPRNWEAQALLGRAHESSGMLVDALAAYRASLEVEPSQAEIRHRVASILNANGDAAGAIEELEKALRIDPGLLGSRLLLEQLRDRQKKAVAYPAPSARSGTASSVASPGGDRR